MKKNLNIRIHGDNIVECERSMSLIVESILGPDAVVSRPKGSMIVPTYEANNNSITLNIQFFPGYNRWEPDIINYVQSKGALLREAADSIICLFVESKDDGSYEKPILAIEFCGALAAGNQAWQRSGRAYAFASAKIPYLYIVEFGGVELDAARGIRAVRLPNPLVPFSYLLLSEYFKTIALPVYIASPVMSKAVLERYISCFGNTELRLIINKLIMGGNTDKISQILANKVLNLTKLLSSSRKNNDTIPVDDWEKWLQHVKQDGTSYDFLEKKPLAWSKTAYISDLTKTAQALMKATSKYAIGAGASNIPICLIPKSKRKDFAKLLNKIYPHLSATFCKWLDQSTPLGICWVMGFKPKGDDARPDRGLPPLARMILGPNIDLLTVVYGPAKSTTWPLLIKKPRQLADQNGLWEAIFAMSSALLVDSATLTKKLDGAFLQSHWGIKRPLLKNDKTPATKPFPIIIGENDVDTIIHLLLTGTKSYSVFEGACNPPGGDWSGISLLDKTAQIESRWISLPRVSETKSKRPDHVFQLFNGKKPPIIITIESKKSYDLIEKGIGKRLISYVKDLLRSAPSVVRDIDKNIWGPSKKILFKKNDFNYASCAAFLGDGPINFKQIFKKTGVDFIICINVSEKMTLINIISGSRIGGNIKKLILSNAKELNVDISITS